MGLSCSDVAGDPCVLRLGETHLPMPKLILFYDITVTG